MKKLFAVLTVVILTVALCVGSFALDAVYVDVNSYQGNTGVAGNTTVTIEPGQKIYILGWYAEPGKTPDKVVWTLNGAEKECSDKYRDRCEIYDNWEAWDLKWVKDDGYGRDDFVHAGFGLDNDMMELLGVDALEKGTYEVSIVGKFTDGSTKDIKGAFTLQVGAKDPEPVVQNDKPKTLEVELTSDEATDGVTATPANGKLVVEATEDGDKWFSIPLDNVDTSIYTSFTIKYTLTGNMVGNNIYLKDTEVNQGWSPASGTWTPPQMVGATEKTFVIADNFPVMAGTTLTGIRIPAPVAGQSMTIESITFNNPGGVDGGQQGGEQGGQQGQQPGGNPGTADASMVIFVVAAAAIALIILKKKVF